MLKNVCPCVFARFWVAWLLGSSLLSAGESAPTVRLDNNLKCVDLSDLQDDLPLDVTRSKTILRPTEAWEHSTWPGDQGRASVGYPTLVRNDHGPRPDGRYYLYYAHHDPNSGIGCAVAESIEGPYVKLAQRDATRRDSRVLICPGRPGQPFHYSSPCVVWDETSSLWLMYFHYYENQWKTGGGHQRTALATCPDLSANVWKPWKDTLGKLVPVLPVTAARWMNSQSSYHAVQRLPDGRWLAFLRGTGGQYDAHGKWLQDPCKLGFATSTDARHWHYSPDNPVIPERGSECTGVCRPHFVGFLSTGQYLLCWSESAAYDRGPRIIYGRTRDFKTIVRDRRGYAHWPAADGLISPWREGDKLYLFAGSQIHIMELPVGPKPPRQRP